VWAPVSSRQRARCVAAPVIQVTVMMDLPRGT
jgi:hypothetical protein